jgi:hypothetical protein
MGWRVFLMRVGSSGWNWFVNVWNHARSPALSPLSAD